MSSFFLLNKAQSTVASAITHIRATQSGDLRSQVERALTSVVLNLAEGSGRRGRDRLQHFRIAFGSLKEAKAGVELMVALSQTSDIALANDLADLDALAAMMWNMVK